MANLKELLDQVEAEANHLRQEFVKNEDEIERLIKRNHQIEQMLKLLPTPDQRTEVKVKITRRRIKGVHRPDGEIQEERRKILEVLQFGDAMRPVDVARKIYGDLCPSRVAGHVASAMCNMAVRQGLLVKLPNGVYRRRDVVKKTGGVS